MSAQQACNEAQAKLEFEQARLTENIARHLAGNAGKALNYGHAGSLEAIAHQIRLINDILEDWSA